MPRWLKVTLGSIAIVVTAVVLVVVILALTFFGPIWKTQRMINRAQKAMLLPENYKPAERMLARMCQSDPAIFAHELNWSCGEFPPACMPIEVGCKFCTNWLDIGPDEGKMNCGAGMIDYFGYDLVRDQSASDEQQNTWVLTVQGCGANSVDGQLDRFSISRTDQLTEEELVKSALANLDWHKAALANGSQVSIYGDDPDYQRKLLLYRHPRIATELGFPVPTAASTQP